MPKQKDEATAAETQRSQAEAAVAAKLDEATGIFFHYLNLAADGRGPEPGDGHAELRGAFEALVDAAVARAGLT